MNIKSAKLWIYMVSIVGVAVFFILPGLQSLLSKIDGSLFSIIPILFLFGMMAFGLNTLRGIRI